MFKTHIPSKVYVVSPGVYAFNDRVAAEWFAPAGLNRGGIDMAVQAERKLTHTNRDTLYVCDAYHNQIYRIYIDPVTNESRINSGNFDLLNAANYRLNTAGKEVLSGATHLYYFNSELYTYNEGIDKVIVLNC